MAQSTRMAVVLDIVADGKRPALRVRPWLAEDMPELLAATEREHPGRGLRSHPIVGVPGRRQRSDPPTEGEADRWLSAQQRGWGNGEWLAFAVLDQRWDRVVGHVGLMNRDGGRVGTGEQVEISYWTAPAARGRGVAPAAVRAVTDWAFGSFGPGLVPDIMLVHDVDNTASCRVAAKSGYPFLRLSPASPPDWFTDGHIHVAKAGRR